MSDPVIEVPEGTARLYLPTIGLVFDRPDIIENPERVWVGVPELPEVERFREFAGSTVSAGFGLLAAGDRVVLAEPCPQCSTRSEWCSYPDDPAKTIDIRCDNGLVRLVSGRVADDGQPAIAPVVDRGELGPPASVVIERYDAESAWLWTSGEDDPIELPGDWSGMSFGVRLCDTEHYQP